MEISGLWKSWVGLALVKIRVDQDGSRISGVATVTSLFETNRYHFKGTINGSAIEAFHHNGRTFRGSVVSPRLIKGVLTLKSGMQLDMTGHKVTR